MPLNSTYRVGSRMLNLNICSSVPTPWSDVRVSARDTLQVLLQGASARLRRSYGNAVQLC